MENPLDLFFGKNDLTAQEVQDLGASKVYSIVERARDLEDAMENGAAYLAQMVEDNFRV